MHVERSAEQNRDQVVAYYTGPAYPRARAVELALGEREEDGGRLRIRHLLGRGIRFLHRAQIRPR